MATTPKIDIHIYIYIYIGGRWISAVTCAPARALLSSTSAIVCAWFCCWRPKGPTWDLGRQFAQDLSQICVLLSKSSERFGPSHRPVLLLLAAGCCCCLPLAADVCCRLVLAACMICRWAWCSAVWAPNNGNKNI